MHSKSINPLVPTALKDSTRGLRRLILATVLIVSPAVFFLPLPETGRFWQEVPDVVHTPIFAGLCFGAVLRLASRFRERTWLYSGAIWFVAVGVGLMIEVIQPFSGRHFSTSDLQADALGAAAGIIWGNAVINQSRGWWVWFVCPALLVAGTMRPALMLVDCALQRIEMPVLASFEHSLELSRWSFQESRGVRTSRNATDGESALRLDLSTGVYPGAALKWPISDWTPYNDLLFDITIESGPPLDLVVKVQDAVHNLEVDDRFHRHLTLSPGVHTCRIALSDIAQLPNDRHLQLDNVSFVQFFTVRPRRARTIFLDNVRLE